MQLYVDIHNPDDRELVIGMPKWYSFASVKVLDDTVIGAAMYTIKVNGKNFYCFFSLNNLIY